MPNLSVAVVAYWATLFFSTVGVGTALFLPGARRSLRASLASATAAGGAAVVTGTAGLFTGPVSLVALATGLPFGPLTLALDPLSAFFLIVIGLVAIATAVYAVGYLGRHLGHRTLRPSLAIFHLLIVSLVVTVSAADAVAFLIAWESMAFLSYLAVNFEYEDPKVIQASYRMLAVSELGMIGIVGGILFLVQAGGGFSFTALRHGASLLSPDLRDLVFLLTLFGFGAKAGLLPLQLWLPEAHPAAPSQVSALLSGVIVKLGLYGMIRIMVDFLGAGATWWGLAMLGLGALTAFIGILHAFAERDLKRILAYSTIENVGIVAAALGLGLTFRALGLADLAAIAGLFALYHLLNHAIYKALLFLGAGAVDFGAGTRDLERLGGLVRRMPTTAVLFLIGSLAIAAVAPFAGYISEWGILETMLQSFAVTDVPTKLVIAGAGALIALTLALAVATFARAYAVGFLAQPRGDEAAAAQEVPRSMRGAMGFLAVVSVGLGILPAFVVTVLDRVTAPLWGTSVVDRVVPPLFTDHPGGYAALVGLGGGLFRGLPVNGLVIIPSPTFSTINSPTYLVLCELLFLGLLMLSLRLIRRLGKVRVGPVWAGGIPRFTPRMQYGAVAYSNPARLIFNGIYHSRVESGPNALAARHAVSQLTYRQVVPPPLEAVLYRPLASGVAHLAEWVKVIQSGSVNQYVLYIFGMVLVILVLQGTVWSSWITAALYLLIAAVVGLVLWGDHSFGH